MLTSLCQVSRPASRSEKTGQKMVAPSYHPEELFGRYHLSVNVNCFRWLRLIGRVQNNSPRHWKTDASGTSDRKIKSFPPKRFFCLSCLCFICFNPLPGRVTRLAEAPSLHVNRPFNRSFAWWRHFTTNSGLYCEANFSNCIFIPKREDKFE